MKTSNLASQNVRMAETGLVWEEKLTNANGSIEVMRHSTFRVRAAGALSVTVDGVLAMTMASGEICLFNSGDGDLNDSKQTVTVTIAGGNAFVQVARELSRPRV